LQHHTNKKELISESRIIKVEEDILASISPCKYDSIVEEIIKKVSCYKKQQQNSRSSTIPAGYTYLAQFIAHDLTFNGFTIPGEKKSKNQNFRTPALDLDSVYGKNPSTSPYLYDFKENCILFKLNKRTFKTTIKRNKRDKYDAYFEYLDLPRYDEVALIPDPRNAEHILLRSLQLLFMIYHNTLTKKIIKKKKDNIDPFHLFSEIKKNVIKVYHDIIQHDLLPSLISNKLIKKERKNILKGKGIYQNKEISIPISFSFAAFRFGHSMVRPLYNFTEFGTKKNFGDSIIKPKKKKLLTSPYINFNQFFFSPKNRNSKSNLSELITPWITSELEDFKETKKNRSLNIVGIDLIKRNLISGFMVKLPSGQSTAKQLGIKKKNIYSLDFLDDLAFKIPNIPFDYYPFSKHSPLWLYILYETYFLNEKKWKKRKKEEDEGIGSLSKHKDKLGPVASMITLKVILGILHNAGSLSKNFKATKKTSSTPISIMELVAELGVEYGFVVKKKK